MTFIKNNTPFVGKIRFKLERYPYYTGHGGGFSSFLNKEYLNLGFIYFVSRIVPFTSIDGRLCIDPKKKSMIESYTGGIIKDVQLKDIEGEDRFMPDMFCHPDGRVIGSIQDGWRYYKNKMMVTDTRPCGVAVVLKNRCLEPTIDNIEGYYGYSPRAGIMFQIGDKLFDESFGKNLSEAELADLPFIEYGTKTIATLKEAEQAAINFSIYIG